MILSFTADELLSHKIVPDDHEEGALIVIYDEDSRIIHVESVDNFFVEYLERELTATDSELSELFVKYYPQSTKWKIVGYGLEDCIEQMLLHPDSTLDDVAEEVVIPRRSVWPQEGLRPLVENRWRETMARSPETLGIVRDFAKRTLGKISDRYEVSQCYGINTQGVFTSYYWFSDNTIDGFWYSYMLPNVEIEPSELEVFDERCMLHISEHDGGHAPADEEGRCQNEAVIWIRDENDLFVPFALCQDHWDWHYPTPAHDYIVEGVTSKFVGDLSQEHLVLTMTDA